MAITNGYCTLAELKARLAITDSVDDGVLKAVVEAASRAIDNWTDRVFYATTATRYFTAEDGDLLFVDDLLTVTTLKTISQNSAGARTYGDTWATVDYDLEPFNSTPKTRIRINPGGRYAFPTEAKGVEIVGSWGYASTAPDAINEACLLQAARLFKRKDSPFGVAGTPETGTMALPRLDPDVRMLLEPYRRLEVL
jgi:hypothetical protein